MSPQSKRKEGKAKKHKFCLHDQCNQKAEQKGFCRLHYISNWKDLKAGEKKRAEKRLNAYIDRMAQRHPTDYLERIKEGLEDEDKFKASMEEMESDSASDSENEFLEKFLRDIKVDSD